MVRIGLGIVEFLDRRLVWFELLADPVSYLQREATASGSSGVHVVSIARDPALPLRDHEDFCLFGDHQ